MKLYTGLDVIGADGFAGVITGGVKLGAVGVVVVGLVVEGIDVVRLKPVLVMTNIPSFSAPEPLVVFSEVIGALLTILPN